jgi:hypothetical protein
VESIKQASNKLEELRAKYFTGTASGAKLTAQFYEENVGDLKKAEQILKHFTEQVPNEPQGYIQLAGFYERQKQIHKVLICYETALEKVFLQPFESAQQNITLQILQPLYLIMAQPQTWKTEDDIDQQLEKINEWHTEWFANLSATLRPQVKPLHKIALDQLKEKRKIWREEDFNKRVQEELDFYLQVLYQSAQALPASFKTLVETMLNANKELRQSYQAQLATADETTRKFILGEMVESLENTLKQVLLKLPDIELVEAETFLKKHLGNKLWELLSNEEQKFLKVGINLSQKEMTYVFAATSLGCAIETTLKTRLFEPIKQYCKQQRIPIHYRNEEDFIAGFFDNKARLMLGNLIGGFNQAFHDGKIFTAPQNMLYLKQMLPNYQPNKEQQQYRNKALWELVNIRNVLHYSSEQSEEKMQTMLDISLHNQQHGFYRYFFQPI